MKPRVFYENAGVFFSIAACASVLGLIIGAVTLLQVRIDTLRNTRLVSEKQAVSDYEQPRPCTITNGMTNCDFIMDESFPDPTWKLYRNEALDSRFLYPREFSETDDSNQSQDIAPWEYQVIFTSSNQRQLTVMWRSGTLELPLQGLYGPITVDSPGYREVQLAGQRAYQYREGDGGCGGLTTIGQYREGRIAKISYSVCGEPLSEQDVTTYNHIVGFFN